MVCHIDTFLSEYLIGESAIIRLFAIGLVLTPFDIARHRYACICSALAGTDTAPPRGFVWIRPRSS